jgi:hypothetical protein
MTNCSDIRKSADRENIRELPLPLNKKNGEEIEDRVDSKN